MANEQEEVAATVHVKNNGELYRGFDEGLDRVVVVEAGAVAEVSELKANQLKADFPDSWDDSSAKESKEVQAAKAKEVTAEAKAAQKATKAVKE